MNVLLGTQAFLLWSVGHPKMSKLAIDALDEAELAYFSPVTLWEIGIKESGRGFDFPFPEN